MPATDLISPFVVSCAGGLTLNKDDSNLLKKEKKDFELLKTKEAKSDTFGPLTNSETERLQNLSIKREKDKDANY